MILMHGAVDVECVNEMVHIELGDDKDDDDDDDDDTEKIGNA